MSRDEAKLGIVGLTQYLLPEYWSWAVDGAEGLLDSGEQLMQHLVQRLEAAGYEVEAAYGVVHDKDEREVWDELKSKLVTELKPRHLHGVVRFAKGKGGTIEQLAEAFGVEPQYVEKAGRGKYAFDNMLSYLTHAKYPEKYQYAPAEVVTAKGADYQGIDAERRESWIKGRASIKAKRAAEGVDHMVDQVLLGELTYEQIMLTDELFEVYARNKRVVDEAIVTFGQRRALKAEQKLRNGEFETTVVFVTGAPGSGKSYFARQLAAWQCAKVRQETGERWSVYQAATNNPLDDWNGEEIVLLDDLRAASMTATEWLLLLDPHNASPAAARYRNKRSVAPRMILVTSYLEPIEFFFYAGQKGDVDEALDQFMRRLSAMVKVLRVPDSDERRYEVSAITRMPESYRAEVEARGHTEQLQLNYGLREPIVFENDGETRGVMGELVARRSSDMSLGRLDLEFDELVSAESSWMDVAKARASELEWSREYDRYEQSLIDFYEGVHQEEAEAAGEAAAEAEVALRKLNDDLQQDFIDHVLREREQRED